MTLRPYCIPKAQSAKTEASVKDSRRCIRGSGKRTPSYRPSILIPTANWWWTSIRWKKIMGWGWGNPWRLLTEGSKMTSTLGNYPSPVTRRNAVNNWSDSSREPNKKVICGTVFRTRMTMPNRWTCDISTPLGVFLITPSTSQWPMRVVVQEWESWMTLRRRGGELCTTLIAC